MISSQQKILKYMQHANARVVCHSVAFLGLRKAIIAIAGNSCKLLLLQLYVLQTGALARHVSSC